MRRDGTCDAPHCMACGFNSKPTPCGSPTPYIYIDKRGKRLIYAPKPTFTQPSRSGTQHQLLPGTPIHIAQLRPVMGNATLTPTPYVHDFTT